jgi:hypothetical protein
VTRRHISGMLLGAAMVFAPACFGDSIVLFNGSFETGSSGVVSHVGMFGGPSAADGWNIWNNDPGATTTTELCTATGCAGGGTPYGEAPGSLPPTPVDGLHTLHVVTTATVHNNGLYTTFTPVTSVTLDSLWVYVVSGVVAQGAGNGGATQLDIAGESIGIGHWQELTSYSPSGVANEMIIYATEYGTPADFFVDYASVSTYSSATPEPGSMALLLGAVLFGVAVSFRSRTSPKGI